MSLVSRIKNKIREIEHKRDSDAASRQMQFDAQQEVEARLTALEIRLINEGRKK